MAVATVPTVAIASEAIALENYLRQSYRPDCDYVDGVLEERNVGEFEHSSLQVALAAWFFNHRVEWKIRVLSEMRNQVSESRVRIPDICVIPQEGPVEKVRQTPPLLCIEILSPEDRPSRVLVRLKDFLAMGVANVWLIDPIDRAAFVYTSQGLRLVEETRMTIADSPIYLDLPELFSALD